MAETRASDPVLTTLRTVQQTWRACLAIKAARLSRSQRHWRCLTPTGGRTSGRTRAGRRRTRHHRFGQVWLLASQVGPWMGGSSSSLERQRAARRGPSCRYDRTAGGDGGDSGDGRAPSPKTVIAYPLTVSAHWVKYVHHVHHLPLCLPESTQLSRLLRRTVGAFTAGRARDPLAIGSQGYADCLRPLQSPPANKNPPTPASAGGGVRVDRSGRMPLPSCP